jgi:hypothetical protein
MNKLNHDIIFPRGKVKYEVWLFAISIFCLSMPFFMWQLSIKPLILIIVFLSLKNLNKENISFLGFFMFVVYLYTGIYSHWSFLGILYLLLLTPLFFAKPKFVKQCFDVFVYIFSLMLIPSLLVYILVCILGINLPHSIIDGLNPDKMGIYYSYPFLVTYSGGEVLIDYALPRFYGYFDEPGVVGTIAGVLLYIKKYNLRSWINIPIFVAGILSFSLFFFLISLIYVIVFTKMKKKMLLIPTLAILLMLLADTDLLRLRILDRLSFDTSIVENILTRRDIHGFNDWYEHFQKTPEYFKGMGAGYNLLVNRGGSSYKNIIVDFGLIYFLVFLAAYIFYGIRTLGFSKELLMAILILFSIIYQRPFIQDLSYIFLIYGAFVFIGDEKKNFITHDTLRE